MPAASSRALQPQRRRRDRDVCGTAARCSAGSPRSPRSRSPPARSGHAPGDCPRAWLRAAGRRAPRPRARCRRPTAGRGGCRSTRRRAPSSASGSTSASGVPGSASGEQHDPGVVGAEADLVLGEDHPVRDLAAHLAALERQPVREHRAGQRDRRPSRRRRSSTRRRRSSAARPRRRRPSSAAAGRRSGASPPRAPGRPGRGRGCRPASATPRRSIALDLGGRDREPRRELLQRHLDRHVLAQPGDGDAHQNCLSTRRSPSQSGADVGDVVAQLRGALEPAAEREARSTPPGRGRRSRTRAGRPCRRRPSRSSPRTCTCGSPRRRRSRTRRPARSTAP